MFGHPAKDGVIDRDVAIQVRLESGLVGAEEVLEFLNCILSLSVGLRFPNSGSFRDHLCEHSVVQRATEGMVVAEIKIGDLASDTETGFSFLF